MPPAGSGPGWRDTAPASHGSIKGKSVPGARPAGRREHAKHCSPCGGAAQPGAPQGDLDLAHPPPAATPFPGSPRGCHKGSRLTRPERLAPGRGGHSQPRIPSPGWRPSPALMSAGLAAFQLIFCPMLCLPSGLLRGPGRGGGRLTQSPQGHAEGCPPVPALASPRPEVPSRSVTTKPQCRISPEPLLAGHNGSGSLAGGAMGRQRTPSLLS